MNDILALSLIILLILAAITAASEISMIAVSRLRLRKLAKDGSNPAQIVLKILEVPEKFFGTILVANNIIDTLIAAIVTVIMVSIFGNTKGIILATIIAAFLIILFEVVAKTYAARHSEKLSLAVAKPMRVMISILSPIAKALSIVTNFIINFIGDKEKSTFLVTEDEIRTLIKMGEEDGTIHKEKYIMLSKVLDFSKTLARSVMTPKGQIVSIDVNSGLDDMLEKAVESGYSRFPVYKDTPEQITGIINMKDLLNIVINKGLIVFQDIVSPPVFVPGSKKITELLREFQKGHTHLAIVTDESGKIEGLVTLEDLLEEIVGEIEDEHDIRSKS
ncbi:MAG: hemolysin family protein [Candidatus Omnitrophica bacterium]|nr:hemolysin family protein [Candidatus Omnitrophota bacterium]